MLRAGDRLPLNLQLWDGAEDMHVRAHVFDALDSEVSGSPVVCLHVAYGLYTNSDLLMLSTPVMKAVYKVYVDSAFATPSPLHSDAIDAFKLIVSDRCGASLIGVMDSAPVLAGDVDGLIHLGGSLFGDILLQGTIESRGDVRGAVDSAGALVGVIDEQGAAGEVRC